MHVTKIETDLGITFERDGETDDLVIRQPDGQELLVETHAVPAFVASILALFPEA